MYDDVTILIQGPLNRRSLDHLGYYKSLCPVVVSYWDTDDESVLYGLDMDGCKLVRRHEPIQLNYAHRYPTFDYQMWSIYNGLKNVRTRYVIRTRSDEFWGNLDPLMSKFLSDDSKVVCGNILFRGDVLFHPGDHLFVGIADTLREAYAELIDRPEEYSHLYAETALTFAILRAMYGEDAKLDRNEFLRRFDVVDSNDLKPFWAQWRGVGAVYDNHFSVGNMITSMRQVR